MNQYSRVSYAVRCQIHAYLQINLRAPEIAKRLGFHKSTIYREINRNSKSKIYQVDVAQKRASIRKLRCRKKKALNGQILQRVLTKLGCDWSPQQIVNRCRLESVPCVSHETIYKYMRLKKNRCLFRYYNRRGYSRYSRYKMRHKDHLSIHQRPEIANQRKRIGDWERDSMKVHGQGILVCSDRKTRYTKFKAYKKYNSELIGKMTMELIRSENLPVRTITNDNGPEFRGYQSIEVPVYYCDPQKPQQRGTVENTIGRLRRRLGRKTKITELGIGGLQKLEKMYNMIPRKCLNYRTPYEVMFKQKVALVS